jgi:hypothetical protein
MANHPSNLVHPCLVYRGYGSDNGSHPPARPDPMSMALFVLRIRDTEAELLEGTDDGRARHT